CASLGSTWVARSNQAAALSHWRAFCVKTAPCRRSNGPLAGACRQANIAACRSPPFASASPRVHQARWSFGFICVAVLSIAMTFAGVFCAELAGDRIVLILTNAREPSSGPRKKKAAAITSATVKIRDQSAFADLTPQPPLLRGEGA